MKLNSGCNGYFSGGVVDKKYQQKIARLAEGVINAVTEERRQKGNQEKPAVVNATDLNVYLQDRAYKHIEENGYPQVGDYNYLNASSILYTYFYCLFVSNTRRKNRSKNDENDHIKVIPQIESDINTEKEVIRTAKTSEEFVNATEKLKNLAQILHEIRTTTYGRRDYSWEKFDNLSSIREDGFKFKDDNFNEVYSDLKGGVIAPWNNLYEIAKTDEQIKQRVVDFLELNNIHDYRITHGLPYVSWGYSDCYEVSEDGKISDKKTPEYIVSFAVNRDAVLAAYEYVKGYFNKESALIDEACSAVLSITDADFDEFESTTESFSRNTIAEKKQYDFLSMFNALPDEENDNNYRSDDSVVSLIPERHQKDDPIPGSKDSGSGFGRRMVFDFSRELLDFENPIFKEYFGESFKEDLLIKKQSQQQKMFETAFSLLKKSVDTWLDIAPQLEKIREKEKRYRKLIWEAEDGEDIFSEKKEFDLLGKKSDFYLKKLNQAESIINNFLYSIFDRENYYYNLQRLTPEQKEILAKFAFEDEKNGIRRVIHNRRYEFICDYLGVLEDQIFAQLLMTLKRKMLFQAWTIRSLHLLYKKWSSRQTECLILKRTMI